MKAWVSMSARSGFKNTDLDAHRSDLLRQQLRARGLEFTESGTSVGVFFRVMAPLDGVEFHECVRLARRYGQHEIVVTLEDGRYLRYNLAPGSGGPSVTSIEELA